MLQLAAANNQGWPIDYNGDLIISLAGTASYRWREWNALFTYALNSRLGSTRLEASLSGQSNRWLEIVSFELNPSNGVS